jgi:hypothetical protein
MKLVGGANHKRNATNNGIDAWISSHHGMVNFRYLPRHFPKGILMRKETEAIRNTVIRLI